MKITQNGPQSIHQVEMYFSFGDLFLSPEDYQRESAWDVKQKKLLIDSVFRNYDIPKFYFWKIDLQTINTPGNYPDGDAKVHYRDILNKKVTENNDHNPCIYEAVDGQQRLRTILEFMGVKPPNNFIYRGTWNDPFPSMDDTPIALGKYYSTLNPGQRFIFESKSLSIVVLEDTTILEVRDMFLRLQNGTPLNAQQKRDALGSNIGRFAREIARRQFLSMSVKFDNSASDHIRVASQMINLEMKGHIESCTSKRLDKLYENEQTNPISNEVSIKCRKINDILGSIFSVRCPNINRSYALSLYWVISKILDSYTIPESEYPKIKDNFINLDNDRLLAAQRDYSNADDERFKDLSDSMSRSTDGKEGIETRHEILTKYIFQDINLVLLPNLDKKRNFTYEEKLIIYFRAQGKCQLECGGSICGKLLDFDESVVDHIQPHSLGGITNINNGRLAYNLCNIARGATNIFDPSIDCKKI